MRLFFAYRLLPGKGEAASAGGFDVSAQGVALAGEGGDGGVVVGEGLAAADQFLVDACQL